LCRDRMLRLRVWIDDLVIASLIMRGCCASVDDVASDVADWYGVSRSVITGDVASTLEKLVLGGLAERAGGGYRISWDRLSWLTVERLLELGLVAVGNV